MNLYKSIHNKKMYQEASQRLFSIKVTIQKQNNTHKKLHDTRV